MSRIRSIHPGVWTDERFVSLSHPARLFLIGLWTEADDQGVFDWSPVKLKMRLAPADNCNTDELLSEIASAEAIVEFEQGGRKYGAIRNFQKYQRPKQPQVRYPLPERLQDFVGRPESDQEKPARGTALGKMLCEKQEGKCFYCEEGITFYRKKFNSLEIDHKTPVSRGGEDDVENLVAACKPCNSLKGALTANEFSEKFSQDELIANCREKRGSHTANGNSADAKSSVADRETGPKKQMEDGGGKMEDGGELDQHRESEIPRERKAAKPAQRSGKEYAFSGNTIKLDAADLDRWKKTYHAIPDIEAELSAIDDWLRGKPAKQADWFHIASGSLGRKHQDYLAKAKPAETPEYVPQRQHSPAELAAAKQRLIDRGELPTPANAAPA